MRSSVPVFLCSLLLTSGAFADQVLDVQYARLPGVDPNLNRLDVHSPDAGRDLPVLVFVHGGSWQVGDKSGVRRAPTWFDQIERRGHVLVSVNFRLWPDVTYREQATDIAAALGWVRRNIAQHRGSPKKVFLLGHSSGAHLVSLLGTDPRYLDSVGLPLSFLKGVIPLDIQAYDIPRAIRTAPDLGWPVAVRALEQIFTRDLRTQRDASPAFHVREHRDHPPFHVVYAPWKDGRRQNLSPDQSKHFQAILEAAGVRSELFGYEDEDHSSLVADFGDPRDAVTRRVEAFVDACLLRGASLPELVDSVAGSLADPSGSRQGTAPGLSVAVVTSREAGVFGLGATQANGRVRPDGRTVFGIASVSKALTGLLVAEQVAAGTLRLADPANRHLARDLRILPIDGRAVTLQHLITHRSGLPSMPSNLVDRDGDGVRDASIPLHSPGADYTRQDLIRALATRDGRLAVGARYAYSNLGAALAGIALQDRLGLPSFDALLERNLSGPLGLSSTGTNTARFIQRVAPQAATGYAATPNGLRAVPFSDMGVLASSGEVITSGDDMLRVLRVFTGLSRGALAPAATEATRSLAAGAPGKGIGYALDVEGTGPGAVFSKAGSCAGYSAYLCFTRSPGAGVVVMANRGGVNLSAQAHELLEVLVDRAR